MVETITPVVHGGSRRRWALAVLVHALASTLGAAVFGAVLGGAGALLGAPWRSGGGLVVAGVAAWAVAHETLGVPFPVPQLRRQVPEWWRTFFTPLASAWLYGAALGIGFLTYVLHATLVAVSVAAFASGRPLLGAVIVAPFGFARGASAVAAVGGPDVVQALADVARRRAPLAVANALALAVVAIAAAMSASPDVAFRSLALAGIAVSFAWSAGWKAVRPRIWRGVLRGYGLGRATTVVALLVPVAEGSVVVLAATGARQPAALLSLAVLVVFTTAAIARRAGGAGRVACGCFGASETSLVLVLVRNAALAAASAVALGDVGTVDLRLPSAADIVPIALSVGGAVGLGVAARAVHRSSGGRT